MPINHMLRTHLFGGLNPFRKDYFDEKDLFLACIAIELSLTRFQIFVSINGFSKVRTALTYQGSFTKWKPRNLAG